MKKLLFYIVTVFAAMQVNAQETRYQEVNRTLVGDWQIITMETHGIKNPLDTAQIKFIFQFKQGQQFIAQTPFSEIAGFWDVNPTADSVAVVQPESNNEITGYQILYISQDYLTLKFNLEMEQYVFYFRRKS